MLALALALALAQVVVVVLLLMLELALVVVPVLVIRRGLVVELLAHELVMSEGHKIGVKQTTRHDAKSALGQSDDQDPDR